MVALVIVRSRTKMSSFSYEHALLANYGSSHPLSPETKDKESSKMRIKTNVKAGKVHFQDFHFTR